MQIDRTDDTIQVTLTAEEAEAVRDDLGAIWASKISTAGDKLHSLLESVTETEGQSEPSGWCTFGERDAPGAGCIKPAGHSGAHLVTPGDVDDD
ncbi:hypothetical protein ACIGMX_34765 [Streptomyces aquilus]|uniref:hypothetical protein n=1 Tax=Streptomyces aquilus TaxID=2548456 RepID=UPI0037D7A970